jgi:hypothetical protein
MNRLSSAHRRLLVAVTACLAASFFLPLRLLSRRCRQDRRHTDEDLDIRFLHVARIMRQPGRDARKDR